VPFPDLILMKVHFFVNQYPGFGVDNYHAIPLMRRAGVACGRDIPTAGPFRLWERAITIGAEILSRAFFT
jgi:hypothetical protein